MNFICINAHLVWYLTKLISSGRLKVEAALVVQIEENLIKLRLEIGVIRAGIGI